MSFIAIPEFESRPTVAEVSTYSLRRNFETVRTLVGKTKIMAVLKANAYGHGIVPCAKVFCEAGADAIGVAYMEEAKLLRHQGITVPIHVFGGLLATQVSEYLELGVDITVPSVSKLEVIDEVAKKFGKRARVQLKIDTGLERLGIQHGNAAQLFEAALRASHVDVIGVFSHFADVNPDDMRFSKVQLERFRESLRFFEDRAHREFDRHIAGSGGVIAFKDSYLDMVRPGIMLYGVHPGKNFHPLVSLMPALRLKSQVVFFKVVKAGTGVSYGLTWAPKVDTRIVTVPVGHGDGFSRKFSNAGHVLIRGKRYPIVGTVCMDQFMVDIGPDGTAYNEDEVVLIGEQQGEQILVDELSEVQGTNNYEVLVLLNQRVPRRYI